MPGTCPGWGDFQSAVGELGGSVSGAPAAGAAGASGGTQNAAGLQDTPPSTRQPGQTAAQWFSAQPDDYRFANMDSRPQSDPGKAWAEDGTQVGTGYWG